MITSFIIHLSVAKTPRRLNHIHVTCCTISLYVVDFKCALNFGEAQAHAFKKRDRAQYACLIEVYSGSD